MPDGGRAGAVSAERDELRRRINAVRREALGWNSAYNHLCRSVLTALGDPTWRGDPRWAAMVAEANESTGAASGTFDWGESVTRDDDRILVPLNTGDRYAADLVLDPAGAQVLADMLHDAAGPEPCPYGGGSCPLDAREHYHLARPRKPDLVVHYGSNEDRRAFPPNGRLGR